MVLQKQKCMAPHGIKWEEIELKICWGKYMNDGKEKIYTTIQDTCLQLVLETCMRWVD